MSTDGGSLEARVAAALVEGGAEILEIGAEGALARLPDGEERALRFGNLRRSLAVSDPARHDAVIARFLRLWLAGAPQERGVEPADRLFPRLLPPGSADGGLAAPWVERLAGGHLLLALCVDAPETVQLVKMLDFPRWRLGVAAAKAAALDRLAQRSAPLADELAARPDPNAPAEIALGDGYDASRLLLAHRWFPTARGVLALAPSRDLLLVAPVCGPRHWPAALDVALGWVRWASAEIHALPYPLSPRLFWRSEGLLEALPLAEGPDACAAPVLSDAVARAALGEHA